jgi:peptidoglycan/xylan/chitin deacetylase (PgdA/CDA1 family)/CelD/BcsL family acetyltransferase involved in cellulose biosynthesis
MKVIEIRREAELQELRPAWESLLRESASNTIFLTWEWVTAWWSSYGTLGDLRLLLAYDDAGVLRGIAPLRAQVIRKYGQTFPALAFVGDGSFDSDYLDFIIAAGHEPEIMAAFKAHWRPLLRQGTILQLNEIPAASPNLPFLRTLGGELGMLAKETDVPCSSVHLPQDWDEYVGMLQPRFRTKIRSVMRKLDGQPEVGFGFCQNQEQIPEILSSLFDLHTRRWVHVGKPGVFGSDAKRAFYANLSALLMERGWLRCSWLEWNGRVLACQYGFAYGGRYFHLQEGYEPASEHWNIGLGLRAWSTREFMKEGLREYDFLGGAGRHKTDWGAEITESKQIVLAGASSKNRLLLQGPEWEAGMRESVKRLLPEQVLAARQERLKKQSATGEAPTAEPSGKWLRAAAANFYFHSGLPAATRSLRDNYQLSISPNGKLPKISWSKRTEASGRVFCYHRVNDEQDPFLPAVSTELFEQQIRYMARHHKTVSLQELMNRLEQGEPEAMLAITFDDGYQDNYRNAFPILRRYGLPATIFLTTGGIDSGQPLWFEQLAEALRKTAREFVDLEIDIPRRFWTRNLAERLDSHNRIFGMVRVLPDAERHLCLTEIFRQLGVAESDQRPDRMLTWDQIRLMKADGIDFGGHTVTHPFLSKTTPEQACFEVSECKRRIEDELQSPVRHFAYPNGGVADISDWNKTLLRNNGYRAAVTTQWGINYRSTDPMELKRSGPWERDQALFATQLDWYQLANG